MAFISLPSPKTMTLTKSKVYGATVGKFLNQNGALNHFYVGGTEQTEWVTFLIPVNGGKKSKS